MPLTSKTFSQLIDFTRTSAATYVDQLGRIVPTPVSPNLITFTQEFDNAAWTKNNATVTVNTGIAPDGTTSADLMVSASATGIVGVNTTGYAFTNGLHTQTFHVKVTTGVRFVQLLWTSGGISADYANFDLQAGTVTAGVYSSATITNVGSGWFRISMTSLAGAASGGMWLTAIPGSSSARAASYTGNGVDGLLIWGAQLEQTPDANLTLGSELVTNGDFSGGSTGWTANAGWTISGGQAASSATSTSLFNGFTSVSGQVYRVAFDVVSYTSGTLSITVGANYTTNAALTGLSPGRYVVYVAAGTNNTRGVEFYGGMVTATVDNVSARAVTAASPSTYTRNFGGRFPPRFDYDPVTLAPRGLLSEEQRTNLLVRSEEFDNASWVKTRASITANAATSPDGTVDADKLVEDTTASSTHTLAINTTNSSAFYTYSIYAKAAERSIIRLRDSINNFDAYFDLSNGTTPSGSATSRSITAAGNGWYRCVMTSNTAVTNPEFGVRIATAGPSDTYTGDGTSGLFLWGAQLEAGAFATSYIPTVASQVTRTADSAAITGANFSPWYNQSEGTFVVDYDVVSTAVTAKSALTTNDGTSNNINIVYVGSSGLAVCETRSGGASQGQLFPSSVSANSPVKSAFAYKANDFAAAGAGGTAVTDNTGTVAGGQTELNIGYSRNYGGLQLCGHIRSIRYYPTRLTNAQLQALTA